MGDHYGDYGFDCDIASILQTLVNHSVVWYGEDDEEIKIQMDWSYTEVDYRSKIDTGDET